VGVTQRTIILFFATGAGAGYFPRFPGTIGTLVAIPLSLGLNRIAANSLSLSLLTLTAFVLCTAWFCGKGEEIFDQKDSGKIVVDEIAGFLVANYLSPPQILPLVAAFVLFRIFDIVKIFPASKLERIPGGSGVVLDDLVAGIYTFLIIRLVLFGGLL